MTDQQAGKDGRSKWLTPTFVLMAAGALRLYRLGSFAWAQDELYTLHDALKLGGRTGGPGIAARPIYFVVQHVLLQLAPANELWMRMPAFVFGLAGVALTWVAAERLFGPRAALVSTVLVAISPWHLYASQFARYWTLVYVLSLLFCWLYPRAVDLDRTSAYLGAMVVTVFGVLTHPTFMFPAVGLVLAVHAVDPEGGLHWRWPTWRAWRGLWIPAVTLVVAVVLVGAAVANGRGLPNNAGHGMLGVIRPLLGMVQWATPTFTAAAGLAAVYLIVAPSHLGDRRWGAMTVAGSITLVALLVISGARADIWADYGMALLPMLFLVVGAAAQRLCERLESPWPWVAAVVVIGAALLPGTVSHLSDGTRWDFRPAFRHIEKVDPAGLVLAWPIVIQRTYAPQLHAEQLAFSTRQLDETLKTRKPFWIVAPYGRGGTVLHQDTQIWMDAHCRTVMRTWSRRLDYRFYGVVLARCGAN